MKKCKNPLELYYRIISPLHYCMNHASERVDSFILSLGQTTIWLFPMASAISVEKNGQEKPVCISRGLLLRSSRNFRDERLVVYPPPCNLISLRLHRLTCTRSGAMRENRSKDSERRKDSDLAVSIISETPQVNQLRSHRDFIESIQPILSSCTE